MDASASGPAATADERFALFVLPEVEVLLRVARTLTPNHADAEDLVQDTLIRAYRAIDRFDGAHPRAGGLALGLPVIRRAGLPLWPVLDGVAPGLALGIAIGRVGDLVVADHLGKPTRFALGFVCPSADTASPCVAPIGQAVHQPALYDLLAAAAILAVLFLLRRRPVPYHGHLMLLFGALYGSARFVEDFFRIDETHGTGLSGSQWTAVTVVALCTWLLARRRTPESGRRDAPLAHTSSQPGESP
jgi:prolipoprotein diacylglyceryltransferase